MVELLLRESEVTRTSLFVGGEAISEMAIKEASKRFGVPKDMVRIAGMYNRVQFSYNSDGHLVVRIVPVFTVEIMDENNYVQKVADISLNDTDILLVFDRESTEALIGFIKELFC